MTIFLPMLCLFLNFLIGYRLGQLSGAREATRKEGRIRARLRTQARERAARVMSEEEGVLASEGRIGPSLDGEARRFREEEARVGEEAWAAVQGSWVFRESSR